MSQYKNCGWCGGVPIFFNESKEVFRCGDTTCVAHFQLVASNMWNSTQSLILDKRKNDYDSGMSQGMSDIYQPMDFNRYVSGKGPEE